MNIQQRGPNKTKKETIKDQGKPGVDKDRQ